MPLETRPQQPREVVLTGAPAFQLEEAQKKFPRAGEVFTGLKWRLERRAEDGAAIPFAAFTGKPSTVDMRMMRSPDMADLPVVYVVYKIEPETVTILKVRAFPPGQDPTF